MNLLYVWIISYLLNILLGFWRLTCFGRKKDLGYKRKKKKKKKKKMRHTRFQARSKDQVI